MLKLVCPGNSNEEDGLETFFRQQGECWPAFFGVYRDGPQSEPELTKMGVSLLLSFLCLARSRSLGVISL